MEATEGTDPDPEVIVPEGTMRNSLHNLIDSPLDSIAVTSRRKPGRRRNSTNINIEHDRYPMLSAQLLKM